MKTLFVFDDKIRIDRINLKKIGTIDTAYLFPLTSKTGIVNKIKILFNEKKINVEVLKTSKIINQYANEIREPYLKFIAELPEKIKVKGWNLREWFSTPDKNASLWWFSLLAEKNTLKTNSFNKLSQLHSIIKIIQNTEVGCLLYGGSCIQLRNALKTYSDLKQINFFLLKIQSDTSFKQKMHKYQRFFLLKHLFIALYQLNLIILRTLKIKKKLGKIRAKKQLRDTILIITYYPNFDLNATKEGIFKNKYYPLVQEALESEGKNIIWIALYIQNNRLLFDDALNLAKEFIKKGSNFYYIEEFLHFKGFLNVIQTFILSCFRFLLISRKISKLHFLEGEDYNFFSLLKNEWYSSFSGGTALTEIMNYERFKKIFKSFQYGNKCLYYFENHAWEKAMIYARNFSWKNLELYGYQHATVSRMLLNYFNHKIETTAKNDNYIIPSPDKIICNGELTYNYMKESGWNGDRLAIAEAIRYNYLNNKPKNLLEKKAIILVVFSINLDESCAILQTVLEGLTGEKRLKIWVKTHPSLKIEHVLNKLKINNKDFPFEIKDDPIEQLLASSKIIIAGETGVSVEAIAFGCRVIILDIPEIINMSPLRYIESDVVSIADSPEMVKKLVYKTIYNKNISECSEKDYEKIYRSFFHLNPYNSKPERLLSFLA